MVSGEDGEEKFVNWFCQLFSVNGSRATTSFSHNEGVVYLRSGTIKTLHEILNIKTTYGLDYQSFFDLLQRVAEEENPDLMKLQDSSYDDVLPLVTLKKFARDFLVGFTNIMTTLGFEECMLAQPEEREEMKKKRQRAEIAKAAAAAGAAVSAGNNNDVTVEKFV